MELPSKKKSYVQKYRKEWESDETFKSWLKPAPGDDSKVFCSLCHSIMGAKFNDLKAHAATKKHKAKYELITKTKPLSLIAQSKDSFQARKAEGSLALYIAEHCAISNIDHLGRLCKSVFGDSIASRDFKMHRTKCTQVINFVIAPHFKEMLLKDIGFQKYSLILDESTDVGVVKYLGIIIRYFSINQNKIVSGFLSLQYLESSDANGIVKALITCLHSNGLNVKNLIGIGTDNATVMTGHNHSVFKILKEQHNVPHLQLIRCVCHSLQLAVSHASEQTIPRNIEFLIRETYNWFSNSTKRREEFNKIYSLINCGEAPLKILKACSTRWLSVEPAVVRVLSQWDELKLHFSTTKDKCYTADLLHAMYSDETNKLYLYFLRSILNDVQIGVKVFESDNADPVRMIETLVTLLRSVCNRIVIPSGSRTDTDYMVMKIEDNLNPVPYLGYLFESQAEQSTVAPEKLSVLKKRCIEFNIKLAKEIQSRLPTNYAALKKMEQLSVDNTLKQRKDNSLADLAKELGYGVEETDRILLQWHDISFVKWDATDDTFKFWSEVLTYKNAAGMNTFEELAKFAVSVLTLPYSNAEVERLFSTMNIVKTKLRNRMSTLTLNSILLIRNQLKIYNKSCSDYELPQNILQKIGQTKGDNTNYPQPSTSSVDLSSSIQDCEDIPIEDDLLRNI